MKRRAGENSTAKSVLCVEIPFATLHESNEYLKPHNICNIPTYFHNHPYRPATVHLSRSEH